MREVDFKHTFLFLDYYRVVGFAHMEAQSSAARGRSSLAPPRWSTDISGVRVLKDSRGRELAYILDLTPSGFIAVAVDTDIQPVIAYSFNGQFSMEDTGQNTPLHMLRQDMGNRLAALPIVSERVKLENNVLWEQYLDNNIALLTQDAEQWPWNSGNGWLDTTWEQDSFYNDSCPNDPNTAPGKRVGNDGNYTGTFDGRCLTGCVATAMGQIVNYWKYPANISFSHGDSYVSVFDPEDGFGERIIIIDATEASMSYIDYNNGDPSQSTIADLLFACGVALEASYSDHETLAYLRDDAYHRLSYASAVEISGDHQSFYDILRENMKNKQPAQLAIGQCNEDTCESGHSVVVDGYRVSNTGEDYHLNFGWGSGLPKSISECWYSLPNEMAEYNVIDVGVLNIHPTALTPTNWYVNPTGLGIQAAIDAAQPGDVINVAAGTYHESISLRDGITLLGEGADRTRIEYSGDSVVISAYQIQSGHIEGFTIAYTGTAEQPTIGLWNSSVIITQNVITGAVLSGIQIGENSNPEIKDNEIRNNAWNGIIIYSESHGIISGNVISGNKYRGILVRENSDPQIIHNTIANNESVGVWVYLDAVPTIRNNIITNNGIYGIDTSGYELGSDGHPIVSFNDVEGNTPRDYNNINKPETDISVEPLFVDSANGDYHLQANSPCRGAADDGSDLGAYQTVVSPTRTLSISSTEAAPGDSITVQISITDATGIASGDMVVRYDPAVITINDVQSTALTADMGLTANRNTAGEIKIGMARAEGLPPGSGALVDIMMTISDNAPIDTETTLSFSDTEIWDELAEVIPINIENGAVKIRQSGIKGDVNKDGRVRSNDASLTLRIVAQLMIPDSYQIWAADLIRGHFGKNKSVSQP